MRRLLLPIGIALGATLLIILLKRIDLNTIASVLYAADSHKVVLALVALAVAFLFKAIRWSLLLRPLSEVHWRHLAYPVVVGNAGNALIPHSGELLRSVMVSKAHNVRITPVLAGIAVERMFDFLAVMALSASILFGATMHGPMATALKFVTVGFFVLMAFFLILVYQESFVERILRRCTRILSEKAASTILQDFRQASNTIQLLRSGHALTQVFVLSVFQWTLIGACIYFSVEAVSTHVPIIVSVGILLLTVAGLTLPTAPGYVGTMQFCFVIGLSGYVAEEQAVAASVIYNFVVTIPVIMAALPAFFLFKLWRLTHTGSATENSSSH